MAVGGHLEPLVSVLRVGGAYGEPWTWSVVVAFESPSTVRLLSAARAPTRAEWRIARKILEDAGVGRIRFDRSHDGEMREHVWRL